MPFNVSCHCGAIQVAVDEDAPHEAMACNCSICRRHANLHHFTTPERVTIERRGPVSTYVFNHRVVQHHFCATCGCTPYAEGTMPDGTPMVEINLRCADLDPATLTITHYDGASR
jgi:hypothetical protein